MLTSQDRIFSSVVAHWINRGIDRAYHAAEAVMRADPNIDIDIDINSDDIWHKATGLLSIRFILHASDLPGALPGSGLAPFPVEVHLNKTSEAMRHVLVREIKSQRGQSAPGA